MAEMCIEDILKKVRETKEALEKKNSELEDARRAVEQMSAEVFVLRQDCQEKDKTIGEKDEAIEDLLAQNQELQESLATVQNECEAMRQASSQSERLMEELSVLLA